MQRLVELVMHPAHAASVHRLGGVDAIVNALSCEHADEQTCMDRFASTMQFRLAHGLNADTLDGWCDAMSMHAPVEGRPPVARLTVQWLEGRTEESAIEACYAYVELGSRLRLKYGDRLLRKLDLRGIDLFKCVQRTQLITALITSAADHYYPPPGVAHVRILHCPRAIAMLLTTAIQLLPARVRERSLVEFKECE
jgi:hypothetical protein